MAFFNVYSAETETPFTPFSYIANNYRSMEKKGEKYHVYRSRQN